MNMKYQHLQSNPLKRPFVHRFDLPNREAAGAHWNSTWRHEFPGEKTSPSTPEPNLDLILLGKSIGFFEGLFKNLQSPLRNLKDLL